MKKRLIFHLRRLLLPLLLALALVAARAAAQGTGYALTWFSIAGGGAVSTATSGYALSGTLGQPAAGASVSAGGYTLSGGLWPGAPFTPSQSKFFIPRVNRAP